MATNMSLDGEIYEIFSWLSLKPLYRLSTVSKSCIDYLHETYFVKKQCHNSSKKSIDEALIIQDDSSLACKPQKLVFSFLPENRSYNDIPSKSIELLAEKGRVLASSNGLILRRTTGCHEPTKLLLCNPATRTWLSIELPSEECSESLRNNVVLVCGGVFGRKNHEFSLDYTLLMFVNNNNGVNWNDGYDVYGLEDGEWVLKKENILGGGRNLSFDDQVCGKDGLYILSDTGEYYAEKSPYYWPYIHHYDVASGNTKILALPHEARESFYSSSCRICLFGWERKEGDSLFDSLCLVKYFESLVTIWVLELDTKGTMSSYPWRKLLSVHIVDDLGIRNRASWTNSFTIMGKNLIFADIDGNLFRYCLEGKDFGKLDMVCKYGGYSSHRLRFNCYSSTLRPCSKDMLKPPCRIRSK